MLNDDNIDRELSAEVESATNKYLAGRACPLCQKPLTCEVTCWVRKIYHYCFWFDTKHEQIAVRAIHRGCVHGPYYIKQTIKDPPEGKMTHEEFIKLVARWTAEYLIEKLMEESEKK